MTASDDRGNDGPALTLVTPDYAPHTPDAVETLEHRFDAYARDSKADMARIVAALARIEKQLEGRALGIEDAHARIDRVELNDLETRRQLAALQKPMKKAKRK